MSKIVSHTSNQKQKMTDEVFIFIRDTQSINIKSYNKRNCK